MQKAKRIFWIVTIGVFVLIVAAVIIVGLCLDGIVKKGVETVGPKITRTSITLDSVGLSLMTGSAKVKGLIVGNPEGYKTSFAINVGTAEVGVNPDSIFSDKIVVRSINVQAPEITFEGNPLSKNNLGDILDSVNDVAKNGGLATTNATTTNATDKTASKPGKKIEVDDFLISNAKVHASLTGMGGKELTLTLPPIHLTNLGKGNDGITATELTRAILNAVTTATIKAVADSSLDKSLKNLGGEGADKIKQGIGGIFGK